MKMKKTSPTRYPGLRGQIFLIMAGVGVKEGYAQLALDSVRDPGNLGTMIRTGRHFPAPFSC